MDEQVMAMEQKIFSHTLDEILPTINPTVAGLLEKALAASMITSSPSGDTPCRPPESCPGCATPFSRPPQRRAKRWRSHSSRLRRQNMTSWRACWLSWKGSPKMKRGGCAANFEG
jgi:hypothetical protein